MTRRARRILAVIGVVLLPLGALTGVALRSLLYPSPVLRLVYRVDILIFSLHFVKILFPHNRPGETSVL